MPRMTKAQIGLLLADADAAARDFRKAAKRLDDLKAQVRALNLDGGKYGDVILSYGTPREILDQQAAREALTKAHIEIPTKLTEAPLVIRPASK